MAEIDDILANGDKILAGGDSASPAPDIDVTQTMIQSGQKPDVGSALKYIGSTQGPLPDFIASRLKHLGLADDVDIQDAKDDFADQQELARQEQKQNKNAFAQAQANAGLQFATIPSQPVLSGGNSGTTGLANFNAPMLEPAPPTAAESLAKAKQSGFRVSDIDPQLAITLATETTPQGGYAFDPVAFADQNKSDPHSVQFALDVAKMRADSQPPKSLGEDAKSAAYGVGQWVAGKPMMIAEGLGGIPASAQEALGLEPSPVFQRMQKESAAGGLSGFLDATDLTSHIQNKIISSSPEEAFEKNFLFAVNNNKLRQDAESGNVLQDLTMSPQELSDAGYPISPERIGAIGAYANPSNAMLVGAGHIIPINKIAGGLLKGAGWTGRQLTEGVANTAASKIAGSAAKAIAGHAPLTSLAISGAGKVAGAIPGAIESVGDAMLGALPSEADSALKIGVKNAAGAAVSGAALNTGLAFLSQDNPDYSEAALSGAGFGLTGSLEHGFGIRDSQVAAALKANAAEGAKVQSGITLGNGVNADDATNNIINSDNFSQSTRDELNARRNKAAQIGKNLLILGGNDYAQALKDTGSVAANESKGFYNPKISSIVINADKLGGETYGHEYGHAIIDYLNKVGSAEGSSLLDSITSSITDGANEGQKYRDRLKDNSGVSNESMAAKKAAIDALPDGDPQKAELQKRFSDDQNTAKWIDGIPDASANGRIGINEEVAAEIFRNIISGKSIAHFDLPQPIMEKIGDAFDRARGKLSSLGFGFTATPEEMQQAKSILYQQGAEARAARIASPEGNAEIQKIDAQLQKIAGKPSSQLTTADLDERDKLTKQRARLAAEINARNGQAAPQAPPKPQQQPAPASQPAPKQTQPAASSAPSEPYSDIGLTQAQVDAAREAHIAGDLQLPKLRAAASRAKSNLKNNPADPSANAAVTRANNAVDRRADLAAQEWESMMDNFADDLRGNNLQANPSTLYDDVLAHSLGAEAAGIQPKQSTSPQAKSPQNEQQPASQQQQNAPVSQGATSTAVASENGGSAKPPTGQVGASTPVQSEPRGVTSEEAEKAANSAEVNALKSPEYARARQVGKNRIVKAARLNALADMLPHDDAGLSMRQKPNGDVEISGNLDRNNPIHAAIAKELGLTPEHLDALDSLQDNPAKQMYVQGYKSAEKPGLESGSPEFTHTERAAELAASKPSDVQGEREGNVTEQNKSIMPFRTILHDNGNLTVFGFSADKFLSNARHIIDFMLDNGIDHPYVTGDTDLQLLHDFQTVAHNHSVGYDATGTKKIKGFPDTDMPKGKGNPIPLDAERANVINMAMHNEVAKKSESGRKPETRAAGLEAINLARLNSGNVSDTGETNPLREDLESKGFDAGKTLESPYEHIRPDLISGKVSETPFGNEAGVRPHGFDINPTELTRHGLPRGNFTAAGFMPSENVDSERFNEKPIENLIYRPPIGSGSIGDDKYYLEANGRRLWLDKGELAKYVGGETAKDIISGQGARDPNSEYTHLTTDIPAAPIPDEETKKIIGSFMPDDPEEKITDAAIRDKDGKIWTGPMHAMAYMDRNPDWDGKRDLEEGFVTNKGRFLDRSEAWFAAQESKQAKTSGLGSFRLDSRDIPELRDRQDAERGLSGFMPDEEESGLRGFHSGLQKLLESQPDKSSPEQLRAALAKGKQAELKETKDALGTSFADWLKDNPKATKQDMLDFVNENKVRINGVEKRHVDEGAQMRAERLALTDEQIAQQALIMAQHEAGIESGKANREIGLIKMGMEAGDTDMRDMVIKRHPELKDAINEYADSISRRINTVANNAASMRENNAKFPQYQLPGAKEGSYGETLITMPENTSKKDRLAQIHDRREKIQDEFDAADKQPETPELVQKRKQLYEEDERLKKEFGALQMSGPDANFHSSHWQEPNVLLHLRHNERELSNGDSAWNMEEEQSDALQRLRAIQKKIARGEMLSPQDQRDYDVLKKFPFQGEGWKRLGLKIALRKAAESGAKWLTWTNGEQQAERYDLSKQLDSIAWNPKSGKFAAYGKGETSPTINREGVNAEDLPEIIGKEAAQRLIDSKPIKDSQGLTHWLEGADLKVGGEGMKGFYDRELPNIANDLVKKWGVKTQDIPTETGESHPDESEVAAKNGMTEREFYALPEAQQDGLMRAARNSSAMLHGIPITEPMREDILKNGQTLFMPSEKAGNLSDIQVGDEDHEQNERSGLAAFSPSAAQEEEPRPELRAAPTGSFRPSEKDDVRGDASKPDIRRFIHFSNRSKLDAIDPGFHGTGLVGEERGRRRDYPELYEPRSYIGYGDYQKEPGLPPNKHSGKIDFNSLYDIEEDPLDLWDMARDMVRNKQTVESYAPFDQSAITTLFERLVKEHGYMGFRSDSDQVAGLFHPVKPGQTADQAHFEAVAPQYARRAPEMVNTLMKATPDFNKIDPDYWKQTPVDPKRANEIANQYEKLKDDNLGNPEVRKSYDALTEALKGQYQDLLDQGIEIEPFKGKGEPYKNSAELQEDLRQNKHLYYLATKPDTFGSGKEAQADHPMLQDSGFETPDGKPMLNNDVLRAVHDAIAHGAFGVQFGPNGEEAAWRAHMATIADPYARRALTTETRGQNSWVNFRDEYMRDGQPIKKGEPGYVSPQDRPFADQKTDLLPKKYMMTGDPIVDSPVREAQKAGAFMPSELDEPPKGQLGLEMGKKFTPEAFKQSFAKEKASDRAEEFPETLPLKYKKDEDGNVIFKGSKPVVEKEDYDLHNTPLAKAINDLTHI